MEKLHNCPNCGGYLNDTGRCEFCGSKVYDFVNADFDDYSKTYIRIKWHGKIVTVPVIFISYGYNITYNVNERPTGTLEYVVVGDMIIEENKDAT